MKKTGILVGAAAILLSACSVKQPKADFKSDVDSLVYAIGVSQSNGLKSYMVSGLKLDTTDVCMDAFIKGILESGKNTKLEDKAYVQGLMIGSRVAQMSGGLQKEVYGSDSVNKINMDNFYAGFIGALKGNNVAFDAKTAATYVQKMMKEIKEKNSLVNFKGNKEAGEKFLAANKTKKGVQVTASGVQYEILKKGKGATPKTTDKVEMKYKGTLIDGTVFDDSAKHGGTATFGVTQVIKGWQEVLPMMTVGSKWRVVIPQELAYGAQDKGTIKPFSTLIFEMELVKIVK